MKNIAVIVHSLSGGGAERIAGLLSKKLSDIYNVYLFVCDTDHIIYEYGGTLVNLSINGEAYIEHYIAEYKRKYKIDCAISFIEGMNFYNIQTRGNECVIISERCTQSLIDPPVQWEIEKIKRLYHYADGIVSVAHGVKYDLAENFGINKSIITTIYNFIDVEGIHEKMKEEIAPDILSFIGNSKVILNIGRLHDQKNQKKIIVQFEKLLYEDENIKLIIVGAGKEREQLQDLIKKLGIDDHVRIIPYGKNPFPYYKLASLFVLASKYEGLPNVLLEAMACGVPIAAVDCLSGPRELLDDCFDYEENIEGYKICKRGILVEQTVTDETGETEYLKEAMKLLLQTEDVRNEIIEEEIRYINAYSNDQILNEWINVIENTQERKPAPPKEQDIRSEEGKKIIIYGAGKVGTTLARSYLIREDEYDLLCFAVSDKAANEKEVLGLPVFGIEELMEYREDAIVLIGVSRQYKKEVTEILKRHGFKNIISPSYKKTDYRYYAELGAEKYKAELTKWYRIYTGRRLNWDSLETYNEKLQWLKLYDQIDDKCILSDKFKVRDFVEEKIGEEHLVPLLGCWDSFDEIDFNNLPKEFVLKCNHGKGWNIVVHDKETLNLSKLKEQFDSWMMLDYAFCKGFELHYKGIERKIIAEQRLQASDGEELREYKVLVFDGRAEIIQVDINKNTDHKRNLYSRDWKYLPYSVGYPTEADAEIRRPDCLEELIMFSETLGAGLRHVRVDFYVAEDQIYFGDMTFTPGSGSEQFTSQEFALKLGGRIMLTE